MLIAEELKEHLIGEHAIDKIFTLGNSEFPISWDNEVKLWTFLEARASLLLKTYKTTVEVKLLHVTWTSEIVYIMIVRRDILSPSSPSRLSSER